MSRVTDQVYRWTFHAFLCSGFVWSLWMTSKPGKRTVSELLFYTILLFVAIAIPSPKKFNSK